MLGFGKGAPFDWNRATGGLGLVKGPGAGQGGKKTVLHENWNVVSYCFGDNIKKGPISGNSLFQSASVNPKDSCLEFLCLDRAFDLHNSRKTLEFSQGQTQNQNCIMEEDDLGRHQPSPSGQKKTSIGSQKDFLNILYDFAVGATTNKTLLFKLQLINLLFGLPEVNLLKLKQDQIEDTSVLLKKFNPLKKDILINEKRKRALLTWIETYFKVFHNVSKSNDGFTYLDQNKNSAMDIEIPFTTNTNRTGLDPLSDLGDFNINGSTKSMMERGDSSIMASILASGINNDFNRKYLDGFENNHYTNLNQSESVFD